MKTKTCKKCLLVLPVSSFTKHAIMKDGLRSWCRPCRTIIVREWCQANRDKVNAKNIRWRKKHLETPYGQFRAKACSRFTYAIRTGRIKRPNTCSHCKKEGFIEGHHADYSKPLDVIWLCKKCHALEHQRLETIANPHRQLPDYRLL